MSQRYFLQCSYNGTRYHGWQIQPNAISVQEVFEDALSKILREEISVVGAGRTDTGVHAAFFILHFDVEKPIPDDLDIGYKLNSFLPADIAVQKVWPVDTKMHARFSAISRTYKYYITRCKNPFKTETSYEYKKTLSIEKMNEAAKTLCEFDDFTSFSRVHTDVKTNYCNVQLAEWKKHGDELIFTITANRFLRNMVRAIVGTLLEVGKGKISVADFKKIIEAKDRKAAGTSAPSQGLFLVDIGYPVDVFEKIEINTKLK